MIYGFNVHGVTKIEARNVQFKGADGTLNKWQTITITDRDNKVLDIGIFTDGEKQLPIELSSERVVGEPA